MSLQFFSPERFPFRVPGRDLTEGAISNDLPKTPKIGSTHGKRSNESFE
jgi:hypothetical protein